MRKLLIVAAACSGLAACNKPAENPAEVATETAAAITSAGTYEYTYEGKPTVSTLAADGTYSDMQDGKVIEQGTWAEKDGKVCFDDDTAAPEVCWKTTPVENGMFTATSLDGKTTLTIKKTA